MADMTVAQMVDSTREHLLGNGRSEMNQMVTLPTTAIAAGSVGATLPQATIYVASTALASTGTVYIHGYVVTYTGLGSGTLTGCSGGGGIMVLGDVVASTLLTTQFPLGGITPGTMLAVDDEELYVWSTNPGASTAIVSRGENSTTPVYHGTGTRVYVNEPFNRSMIMNAIMDDIRSWGPQVYQVKTADIATVPYQRGYDLGAISPYYNVLDVRMTPYPTFNTNDNLDWKPVRFFDFQSAPTSDFPSGNALIISDVGGAQGGDIPNWNVNGVTVNLHITYAAAFNVDSIISGGETTTMGATVGLDETEFDIPPLGAAWRLMMMREARRATQLMQGEPRTESEIPPLYISKAAEQFKILRDGRLNDAQYRLMRMYPTRMMS
jgi:hypothetical protein